jgi:hypothetical protein
MHSFGQLHGHTEGLRLGGTIIHDLLAFGITRHRAIVEGILLERTASFEGSAWCPGSRYALNARVDIQLREP